LGRERQKADIAVLAMIGAKDDRRLLGCRWAKADMHLVSRPRPLATTKLPFNRFRESLLIRGTLPIIPSRSNRKVQEHPDHRRYRDRNRVERMFGKLKQQRRIATRYDKTVLSFESFFNLAATRLWLKSFVNPA
jgi:transposase